MRSNMRSIRLLDKIEREALDGDLSKALRLCLTLGGRAGSAELRAWASKELNGYRDEDIPQYRVLFAPLRIDGFVGHLFVTGQTISPFDLPDFAQDDITEEVWLAQSVPGLIGAVMAAKRDSEPVRMTPPDASVLVSYMNRTGDHPGHIDRMYWAVAPSAMQEVIDRVRSLLVELVSEMRAGMAADDALPSPEIASQAVAIVVNGDKNRIKVKDSAKRLTDSPSRKSALRRSLEVGAWVAGIAGTALLVVVNWGTLFG